MEEANTSISIDNGEMAFGNMTLDELLENYGMLFNTTSTELEQEYRDILEEEPWHTIIIVIYSLVIFCGFVENATIIGIFIKYKHLNVPTNIFIVVLSMSDILLCSFNLPLQLYQQLSGSWIYGEIMCKVLNPTYGIPVFMSSMSMLLIAVDRFGLIVHPHNRQMSTKTALGLVTGTAIFSISILIPMIVQMEYVVIDIPMSDIYTTVCIENWKNAKLQHAYTIALILIQFFLPLFATSFLYVWIGLILNKNKFKNNDKMRKKTNNILIAIVTSFSICWLPWIIFSLLLEFNYKVVPVRYFSLTDCILKIFAMVSACINPFLYGWLNNNFRRHLPQ